MHQVQCTIHTRRAIKPLGDLFGIFFEDLNHAADGGLYAEMVQNRSFEFDAIDHPEYHALTAWTSIGDVRVTIETHRPLHADNPHYARMQARRAGGGLRNAGFGQGMPQRAGEGYLFRCFARSETPVTLQISIAGTTAVLEVQGDWKPYEARLTAPRDAIGSALSITLERPGCVDLDMVSLFPEDTYLGRENGLRKDIAQALAALRPKFLRFPGGCLVHDGALDPNARDSMYRWKQTLGPVWQRPARRNNWRYNQTLGLGYFEYFQLAEDIGAKPLPVLPGGCDPHHKRFAPVDALQPWIDDALDLIEFATGPADSTWGKIRAQCGHPGPFALEYIGIGNEEVGAAFFERLPYFVRAIRERAPWIKIIGTTGPFAAGGEYQRGWQSARELGLDLVDEHYYQSPQWFLANMDRYHQYPEGGPRVFLGEYASWGNTYENALVEAAYMVEMQNAPAVALACYAPMLCHADYVNWQPDLIWFDQERVLKTANYYVQQLFMCHQGDDLLEAELRGAGPEGEAPRTPITGGIALAVNDITAVFSDITLQAGDAQERFADVTLSGQSECFLTDVDAPSYTLCCKVRRVAGWKGVKLIFGRRDDQNHITWGVGGWENQDTLLNAQVQGRGSCLTQSEFSMRDGHTYDLRLEVRGRAIRTYIDGALANETEDRLPHPQSLYCSASRERETGDIILKAVNVREEPVALAVSLPSCQGPLTGERYTLDGYAPSDRNTFEQPDRITPREEAFAAPSASFVLPVPPRCVTVLRLREDAGRARPGKRNDDTLSTV